MTECIVSELSGQTINARTRRNKNWDLIQMQLRTILNSPDLFQIDIHHSSDSFYCYLRVRNIKYRITHVVLINCKSLYLCMHDYPGYKLVFGFY